MSQDLNHQKNIAKKVMADPDADRWTLDDWGCVWNELRRLWDKEQEFDNLQAELEYAQATRQEFKDRAEASEGLLKERIEALEEWREEEEERIKAATEISGELWPPQTGVTKVLAILLGASHRDPTRDG